MANHLVPEEAAARFRMLRIGFFVLAVALFTGLYAPVAAADTDSSDDPAAVEQGFDTGTFDEARRIEAESGLEIDENGPINDDLNNHSGVYNRYAAVAYAHQYVGSLVSPRSSAGYNPNYYVFRENDCQNYVSQSLHAGGLPMVETGTAPRWFYQHIAGGWSTSWSVVTHFMEFARTSGRGRFVKYWSYIRLGDVVFVDWTGSGSWHSMLVTDVVGSPGHSSFDIKLNYHTNNRKEKSLKALMADNPNAKWWAFHVYGPVYD